MRNILEVGSEQLPLLFYRCQINKVTYKYLFLLKHPNPPCICKKSRPFCSWPAFSCQTDHSDPGSYFFLHHSLLRQLKGALQRYNTVKYHCIRRGILCIHTEEALSYELEAVICLRILQMPALHSSFLKQSGNSDSGSENHPHCIRPFPHR